MAVSAAELLLLGLVLCAASLADGAVILIGGAAGWTTGFNYDDWALKQNIQVHVGDSLVFKNLDSLTHTVARLDSLDAYQMCVFGGAASVTPVIPGSNVTVEIPATLQGQTFYIVCTVPGHCEDSQKITGTVLPPAPNDADMNRIICWTTAILLIVACFWNLG